MKSLDDATRRKVYPALMSRAMAWFRWSALVTVLVGLRYYMILLQADADNAGHPGLMGRWLGEWFLVWSVAYAILYALQMPFGGPLGNGWVRAIFIALVVIAASWVILDLNAGPESSNAHLAISVGGGIGFVMLFNVWGIVWRVQKRMIQWTQANAENGAPIPEKCSENDALREYRVADGVLAIVSDAIFHGRRGAFSVSRRCCAMTIKRKAAAAARRASRVPLN